MMKTIGSDALVTAQLHATKMIDTTLSSSAAGGPGRTPPRHVSRNALSSECMDFMITCTPPFATVQCTRRIHRKGIDKCCSGTG